MQQVTLNSSKEMPLGSISMSTNPPSTPAGPDMLGKWKEENIQGVMGYTDEPTGPLSTTFPAPA